MQFFSLSDLKSKGSTALSARRFVYGSKSITLANEASEYNAAKTYDLFLSHSSMDADIVYGLKSALEESGLSVYVYWINDVTESIAVNSDTAERLRQRMKSCKCLLYATSDNAQNSKWMPWELGYFDGARGKVAVCPITNSSSFDGREYLGLYPIMEKDFWLWKDGRAFMKLHAWLKG
jgi:hypothetical protein